MHNAANCRCKLLGITVFNLSVNVCRMLEPSLKHIECGLTLLGLRHNFTLFLYQFHMLIHVVYSYHIENRIKSEVEIRKSGCVNGFSIDLRACVFGAIFNSTILNPLTHVLL